MSFAELVRGGQGAKTEIRPMGQVIAELQEALQTHINTEGIGGDARTGIETAFTNIAYIHEALQKDRIAPNGTKDMRSIIEKLQEVQSGLTDGSPGTEAVAGALLQMQAVEKAWTERSSGVVRGSGARSRGGEENTGDVRLEVAMECDCACPKATDVTLATEYLDISDSIDDNVKITVNHPVV